MSRAQSLITNKQWQKAEEDIKSYLLSVPDDSPALSLLYTTQTELGKNKEALANLNKALSTLNKSLKSNKPSQSFLEERAELYAKNQEPEKAIQDLRLGTKLYPNSAHFWARLGQLLSTKEQSNESIICVNRTMKIDPTLKAPCLTRAEAYLHLDQGDKAVSDFKTYLRYYPKDITLLYNNNKNSEALQEAQKWVQKKT